MIVSFADRDTEALFNGRFSRRLGSDIQRVAQRKLRQVHQASKLSDLASPPGNRLEALCRNRREEFLKPLGITPYRLAKELNIPTTRIQAIVAEKRGITGDTALRLGRYFNTTPEFWLNMQRDYELELASETVGAQIERDIRPRAA